MQEMRYVRPENLPDAIDVEALDGHIYRNPRLKPSAPAPGVRLANRRQRRARAKAARGKGGGRRGR